MSDERELRTELADVLEGLFQRRNDRNRILRVLRQVEKVLQLEGEVLDGIANSELYEHIDGWPSKNEIHEVVCELIYLHRRKADLERLLAE